MPFVTVGRENSAAIRIYYEDHGTGSPVVLVHGYALNGHSWEKQEAALLAAGHRVITYDRRGSGASSRPSTGYDFDTLAADLHALLSRLDLREVVLAGFALGTGEVTRYLAAHGPGRVTAAVLVTPLLPFLLQTHDNPDGIDQSIFDGITARIAADRPAAMKDFLDRSYNVDLLGGDRVSDQAWQNSFYVAISASAQAALGCVTACLEDFRGDLATISIPVLVIHGDQDRVLPYEATSSRLPALLKNARSTVIAGGRGGDAVAGQVQAAAQRGELPGHRAERGQCAGRLQGGDDVAPPLGAGGQWPAGPWRALAQGKAAGVVPGEQPGRDGVQHVVAGTGRHRRGRHRGVVRRPGWRVQVDPDGGLAGGGDQVQPLRVMRRAGLEQEGPPVGAAAQVGDHHLVAGPPVVGGGELLQDPRLGSHGVDHLAGGPHVQAQLMAGLGLRVRQQVHLAAGLCAQGDHLPQPDYPARHRAGPGRQGGHRHGRPEPHAG